MSYPNTLIFVDLASDDPQAAGEFYAKVFGWQNDARPAGVFHRMVPGQHFLKHFLKSRQLTRATGQTTAVSDELRRVVANLLEPQ